MRTRTIVLLGLASLVLAGAAAVGGCRHDSSPATTDTEVTVHVGKIVRTTLHRYVAAYGRVEPEPASAGRPPARAVIGAPVAGLLTHIRCAEGERVAKGALLFELDSRTAEVAVTRAQTALDYAERTLSRQRELLEAGGTSERAVQDAEQLRDAAADDLLAASNQLDLLRITAPIAGTVVRIDAALGQPVEPNTVLAEIIDLVWKAKPQTILFEAANPRHAHEWLLFDSVKVPDDKILCPGVIEPQSNYIEHPELVAQRIERDVRDELYASLLAKSMTFHDFQPVGEIMARVTNDVREMNLMMNPGVNLIIGSGMFLLLPLIAAPIIHPAPHDDRWSLRRCVDHRWIDHRSRAPRRSRITSHPASTPRHAGLPTRP